MTINCLNLRDPVSAATARIAVGFGFNLFDFTVERQGRPIPLLWSASDFETGQARPSGSGIPILFPFPGRIQGTTMHWQGREFRLADGDGRGNAIHGFVHHRPWRVVEQSANRVVGEFHARRDDASLLESWPADFQIRATYELCREHLKCQLDVTNPDSRPLPCGLGTHPYFRVPLGGPQADACVVQLPVTEQWELRDMIATGVRSPVANAESLQRGRPFGELQFDNVFTGLKFTDGWCCATVRDPSSGVVIEQRFDGAFRECVVYTPGHREAICIEPYSCVPGAADLVSRGIDAGLRVLSPGESFSARIDIGVSW